MPILPFGDTLFGVTESPSMLDFSLDKLPLVHMGVGVAIANLPPIAALAGTLIFLGYQLSQTTESMEQTSTEIFEMGLGMAIGWLLPWHAKLPAKWVRM